MAEPVSLVSTPSGMGMGSIRLARQTTITLTSSDLDSTTIAQVAASKRRQVTRYRIGQIPSYPEHQVELP
ncbi:hypothetical protein A0H81_03909 [Grifola frondosa]|uniref:Uncharacterized protein n=1 Tax=Grifola frondosa TaxID=5627 RepID=A0A1C7MH48_GRIFR|nr:hypothetical protein A0H81_03909 [Grifola frondosa]